MGRLAEGLVGKLKYDMLKARPFHSYVSWRGTGRICEASQYIQAISQPLVCEASFVFGLHFTKRYRRTRGNESMTGWRKAAGPDLKWCLYEIALLQKRLARASRLKKVKVSH